MKYVLDANGIAEYTDEVFNGIPAEAFSTSFEDIENGMSYIMSDEQIEFYLTHKDHDWRHIFTMTEYTDNEIQSIKDKKNIDIKNSREGEYKKIADPLYMGYIKNMALGNDEKATEYYNKWLEAIQTIKEENPYIE